MDTTLTGSPALVELGWNPLLARSFALIEDAGREPARVVAEHMDRKYGADR